MTWPRRRRSWWRSTGGAYTSSWRSTTCWTWQWSVTNHWWRCFTCVVTAGELLVRWKRYVFVQGVGVKQDEKLRDMGKNHDLFFLNWILFCPFTMWPDHKDSRFITRPGSSVPSALSRSPFSPHQAPCVHRYIQEGEKNKHSSEPTVRHRNCCAQTKQPPQHTVHPCCCTQDRRKCHFIKMMQHIIASLHSMKHVQHLQTLNNRNNLPNTQFVEDKPSVFSSLIQS